MRDLETEIGRIDIYLFDQLLRGNIRPGVRVLDAGCSSGRNLVYLMRSGYKENHAQDAKKGTGTFDLVSLVIDKR